MPTCGIHWSSKTILGLWGLTVYMIRYSGRLQGNTASTICNCTPLLEIDKNAIHTNFQENKSLLSRHDKLFHKLYIIYSYIQKVMVWEHQVIWTATSLNCYKYLKKTHTQVQFNLCGMMSLQCSLNFGWKANTVLYTTFLATFTIRHSLSRN